MQTRAQLVVCTRPLLPRNWARMLAKPGWAEPNYEGMDFDDGERWLAGMFRAWKAQGHPIR